MALTSAQIINLATQMVGTPKYTVQAGQLLNMILSDLCQMYDYAAALGSSTVSMTLGNVGPYNLPADYLRMAGNEVRYSSGGSARQLTNLELNEFDVLNAGTLTNGLPTFFATDLAAAPAVLYVFPPPNGAITLNLRYYRQVADIATPETSNSAPWFPNASYLLTRLAGELMRLNSDPRYEVFLGDSPAGAQGILLRFNELQADDEGRYPMGRQQKMQKI